MPGGTVLKNEAQTEAVHRVTEEELGVSVIIDERLGTYEHFYDTSEIGGADSKHYVATAYRCQLEHDDADLPDDDQHSMLDVFCPPYEGLHPYVERYLDTLWKQHFDTEDFAYETPPQNSGKISRIAH